MSGPVTMTPLASARTWLFAPAHRPDVIDKALTSRADVVILDLEDGVPDASKAAARALVSTLTRSPDAPSLVRTVVRVNPLTSAWGQADLAALGSHVHIMLPKATLEGVDRLTELGREGRVVALVESARGVQDACATAEHPSVVRLAFGHLDFAAEAGADPDSELALVAARSRLVHASVLARRPGPVDGVFARYRDTSGLLSSALHAKALGFSAKMCIHPSQCQTVREAFTPSGREVEWARSVLEAGSAGGARTTGAEMVDEPVKRRARQILSAVDQESRP